MRFVVCVREADGTASVLGGRVYESRAEAVRALSAKAADARVASGELFLIDLDATSPVVLLPAGENGATERSAAPDRPRSEELPYQGSSVETGRDADDGFFPQPAEPSTVIWFDEPGTDDVVQELLFTVEATSAADETAPDAPVDLAEFSTVLIDAEPAREEADESRFADEAAGSRVPDEDLLSLLSLVAEEPREDSLEEMAAGQAAAEDVSNPDVLAPGSEGEAAVTVAADETDRVEADPNPPEDVAEAVDAADDQPASDVSEQPPSNEDVLLDVEEGGYFRIDFEVWTCKDCVFGATCDRAGSDRPATCESFQWRPE